MGEIRLDNFCRLCLKESFTLSNIFSSHSPSGDLLYRVLNFVYDLKILPDDILPPKICAPCLWKMLEFDTYKKNVHFAEAEIVKFLGETRLDSNNRNDEENDETSMESDSTQLANNGISSKQGINTDYMKAQENEMNRASEGQDSEHADDMLSIKDEMDIEEWEMPKEKTSGVNVLGVPIKEEVDIVESEIPIEIVMQERASEVEGSENGAHADDMVSIKEELDIVESEIPREIVMQSTRSSDLKNFQNFEASEETARNSLEGKSSSICTSQDNSFEISDTNKTINEKDLRADVGQEEESAWLSKSILNDTKSEPSPLKAPLSVRKSGFICDICKKSFTTKQNLGNHFHNELIHLRKKLKKSGFICDICKKSFKSKWNLGNHLRVHNGERPFSCNICDKTFRQDIARYMHELRHMRDKMCFGKSEKGIKKKQFSCTLCGKNFSTKNLLRKHSNLHGDKYKCNSCGRRFRDNVGLTRHIRTHTKEKPFKCEVCLKCFSIKSNLKTHLHIHSRETLFSCEICDKTLQSKEGKTVHELIHFREK